MLSRLPAVRSATREQEAEATLHPLVGLGLALPGSLSLVARTPSEVDSNLTPLLLDVCAEGISLFGDAYFHPLLDSNCIRVNQEQY